MRKIWWPKVIYYVLRTIFSGGSETSATAVEWAMLGIIKNPRVMREAQAEVRRVFEEKGMQMKQAFMNLSI